MGRRNEAQDDDDTMIEPPKQPTRRRAGVSSEVIQIDPNEEYEKVRDLNLNLNAPKITLI